ncbi:MAG: hypothetical protein KF832_21810 [Caldilineaceae bacterium]|nr:hypothetical protein [Caldilineaceae bacterium]
MTTDSVTPTRSSSEQSEAAEMLIYDQPWLKSLLHPFLIAVLVGCLDIALLALISRLVPALAGGYGQVVLGFSLLVTILGCATTSYLAQPGERQRRRPTYRWVEFAFVVVATRLVLWGATGSWPTLAALIYQPVLTLVDGLFLSAGLVVILSWGVAISFTEDLLRLALQPDELFALGTDRLGELIRSSSSDRPAILQRIVARWVGGGILMVMAAAGLQIERPTNAGFFTLAQQNIAPTVIAAIVIYFLTGLVLVSQGQLALLRTRWLLERLPSSENVLRQWPLYVMLLLILIGLFATLLPLGGTFLLGQILFGAVSFVIGLLLSMFRFIMGLFLVLMALIMGESPEAPPPEAPPPPPAPTMDALPPATAQLPEWTGGALFWISMALILGYAAYIYLSDRGVQFTWLLTFWQLLRARWRQLFGRVRQWQRTLLPGRVTESPTDAEVALVHWSKRGLDWRRLDPTQQVRYFYLSMLEEAKARGIVRSNSETPDQFAPRLAAALAPPAQSAAAEGDTTDDGEAQAVPASEPPVSKADENDRRDPRAVQKLTEAFVRARYSKKTIQAAESVTLARVWENLKVYLRL